MTVVENGSSSTTGSTPTTYSFTASYSTVYVSSTTYKVSLSEEVDGESSTYTVWVQTNGNVVAIDVDGYNDTGSTAASIEIGVFAAFTLQVDADASIAQYTNTGYFHSTGTSTQSIGPTQVKVTTWSANALPETVSECGTTTTLTTFAFSEGTPSGATLPLVTYEDFAGSSTSNGSTTNFQSILQVTSVTLA